ncbi:MAG TPA: SIMPL domain-containing protein, partial [Candidatus Limnocylindrales bacterium]
MDSITTGGGRRSTGIRLTIVAVAALAVGLVAGPVLAGVTAPRPYAAPNAAATDTTKEHTISVGGLGKVTVTPDLAHVQLGVQIQKPTAKAARDAAATAMAGVVASVKKLGVDDKDIKTTQVSLSAVYDYPNNAAPVLRGYQLTNQVAITVRDLTKLSDIIDNGVGSGATTVDGISFDVADRTSLEAQARDAAAKDARAKADVYAKSLGLSIIGVASVSEQVSTPV